MERLRFCILTSELVDGGEIGEVNHHFRMIIAQESPSHIQAVAAEGPVVGLDADASKFS